tara:strand:+ start:730 stop:936 length:207 start_codon:yes stop_codon:yes gene_type:complete
MGKGFKLKPQNNYKKKKYQTKIVEKKIEYVTPVKEYIKPFRKVYFGFYEDFEPPKVDFEIKPSELWDK